MPSAAIASRCPSAAITRAGAPVYVDYAHTPDAVEAAAAALKPHAGGRLILVLGAGGDRDPGKREAMGQVAAANADQVIVTDDNPRSEDPLVIAQEVTRGVLDAGHRGWAIEVDRHAAIAQAIAQSRKDDVVLVAGKGHETYQERKGERLPFSDAREAAAALDAWSEA